MVHNKVRIPTADHVLVSADLHDKCKKYKKPNQRSTKNVWKNINNTPNGITRKKSKKIIY